MIYFCTTSTKCLFCKKKCTELDVGNKDDVREGNDGPDKDLSTEKAQKDREKCLNEKSCSCFNSPVPFLGTSFDGWRNKKALHENLKYAFLLRRLLDYPKRKCMKYLKQHHQLLNALENVTGEDNEQVEAHGDGWFSVCEACTEVVEEGHRIYHEIERLTEQLDGLKDKLKNYLTEEGSSGDKGEDDNNTEDGVEKEVEDLDEEEEEEEEETIYAEIRDYFMPRSNTPDKRKGNSEVVKMEIEAALTFADDDDFLPNDTFDDGSDWAPSEIEEMDAEPDAIDIKPDISELSSNVQEKQAEETKGNESKQPEDGKTVDGKSKYKPGPKSRKMLRATRSSMRKKVGSSEEGQEKAEELPLVEVETDPLLDVSVEQKEDSKKKRKTPKSILSDTESESMTDSGHSDDSDSDFDKSGKDKFSCDICDATYYAKHRLTDHKKLHKSDDAYKCTECPFVSRSKRGINMHTSKKHFKKTRRSEGGSQHSISPKKKRKPLKVGDHACRFCPVTFQTGHRLREHEEQHLNLTDDMIKCQHCNYICLLERGMKIHVTKYHRETIRDSGSEKDEKDSEDEDEEAPQSYECRVCGIFYKTSHRLREHLSLHRSNDSLKCTECPCVFRTQRRLTAHLNIEHGIKPPKKEYIRKRIRKPRVYTTEPQNCDLCPAKYYTYRRFQQHLKLHTSTINYPCEECGWVFSTNDKRGYHMKLSHKRTDVVIDKPPPKTYPCNHCAVDPFGHRYELKQHLLQNHKDKIFYCPTCEQIYESQQLFDLHITKCNQKVEPSDNDDDDDDEDYEDSSKFSCAQCNCKYKTQELLNRHFALKHSTESFPCTICSIVFPTESRLRYHMARNHDKIQNICKVCGYKAHGASHLRLHMQKHTKERLFSCELCGKTFVSPTYLTGHKQMEHYQELGLKPIKCEECDLLFASSSILKYHNQKVHEKKFKYFCEVCGKGFLFMSGLKHHSAIHSTERNEICQICGAAYVHNRVLMEHIKHHHPEEYAAQKGVDRKAIKVSGNVNLEGPFICKFCSLEFPSRWALHTHLKSHTEVYDKYKCGICGKGYSSPAGVKRHEDTAHGAAIYDCQYCGKTFPCKDYLRYHIKNHCPKKDPDSDVKIEPGPTTSKRRRKQTVTSAIGTHDPHIIKEAGQLHIVTPNTAAAASASTTYFHHSILPNQQHQSTFLHVQPGSEASSSSSYASVPQQVQQHLSEEAAVITPYRNFYLGQQQGFHK